MKNQSGICLSHIIYWPNHNQSTTVTLAPPVVVGVVKVPQGGWGNSRRSCYQILSLLPKLQSLTQFCASSKVGAELSIPIGARCTWSMETSSSFPGLTGSSSHYSSTAGCWRRIGLCCPIPFLPMQQCPGAGGAVHRKEHGHGKFLLPKYLHLCQWFCWHKSVWTWESRLKLGSGIGYLWIELSEY